MLSTRMRAGFLSLPLLLACCVPCCAQTYLPDQSSQSVVFDGGLRQAPPPNPATVRRSTLKGTVVNSITGEPIRRAVVRTHGSESHSAFTAADGRFEIADVPEGRVYVTAQKPGFFDAATASSSNGRPHPPPAPVIVGPATEDLVLKLIPEATIEGHVFDQTGEPIESVNVQMLVRRIVSGRRQWQQEQQAATDDTGAFSIANLVPGSYAIRTAPRAVTLAPAAVAANGTARAEVYPVKYYPDAPDLTSIQAFDLKPGEDLPVDFTLSPIAGFRLSGTVVGAQDRSTIFCEDADGQRVTQHARLDPRTGKFTISGVPPGSYTVRAFSQFGPDGPWQAEQSVEVTSSDIANLVLQLQPPRSIPVHVEAGRDAQQAMVFLTPTAGSQMRAYNATPGDPANPQASLSIRGIPAGRYTVAVRVPGGSACVDSVLSGATDLTRDELTVAAGSQPPPIEVTLRQDCATISGSVHAPSEQPITGAVLLVSDSPAHFTDPVPLGVDGKFSFANLTPGRYHLFAFNNISDLEYANPEVLRAFSGQEVTVGPNQKAELQLDLIAR